jgi:hypothetical protein
MEKIKKRINDYRIDTYPALNLFNSNLVMSIAADQPESVIESIIREDVDKKLDIYK